MKTTGNLGLKKPDGTNIVDITDLNGNMDILDTAVKAVQDHAADTVKHITAAERVMERQGVYGSCDHDCCGADGRRG